MKARGRISSLSIAFLSRRPQLTLDVSADPEEIEKYKDMDLDITITKHRKHRSLDANACLWACIHDIAEAIHTDRWSVYLYMLRRYGRFTHILVKPEAVDATRKMWRETEIVGERDVYGVPMVEMLCFYGSSTYNSKEFSTLLDGVISEMKEMHLETPADAELRQMIKKMEERDGNQAGRQA